MTERLSFCVAGAGSWGTALASHLAGNGHPVTLWGRSAAAMQHMATHGVNQRYLPDQKLAPNLRYSSDVPASLATASQILVAVPSHSFADMVQQVVDHAPADAGLIWACKGFEPGSGRLLSELLDEARPTKPHAILSGPTFAAELVAGLPTAITVAANQPAYAAAVSQWMHNERFRVYSTDDLCGVQVGGALKNIYAIAAGISDGLGFGANARAALITRGLAELMRLAEQLGARKDTLMGLSGMGDLILTCTDNLSRNRRFGLAIAEGLSVSEARQKVGQSVEGIAATRAAHALGVAHQVELPIVEQLYGVLEHDRPAHAAVTALLQRQSKAEVD